MIKVSKCHWCDSVYDVKDLAEYHSKPSCIQCYNLLKLALRDERISKEVYDTVHENGDDE